jgi:uracil-DNA glycosylase family 4
MSHELESWLRYYRELGFTHLYRKGRDNPQTTQITQMQQERSQKSGVSSQKTEGTRHIQASAGPSLSLGMTSAKSASSVDSARRDQQPASLFPAVSPGETLDEIRQDLGDCRRCKLSGGRKSIVFGSGNPKADLVFVGEGPGADEDEQGLPFVGRAGQLLTEMIEKGMKIPRPDVYICNIVKCRPPDNRKPEKDEVAACRQFVERQLDSIQPRVICALGATAAETLLGTRQSMGSLRGQWFVFHGFPLVVTYHPAFLLRDPTKKRDAWEDLKMIVAHLKQSD